MAKRRANNEGTVYELPNGKVRVQVTINGRRLSHTAPNRKAAHAWRKKMLAQAERGLTYDGSKTTLEDYLTRWLASTKYSMRPKTHDHYTQLIRDHLIPTLGPVMVAQLTVDQVQYLYDALLADGVGVYTVHKLHNALHSALQRATKTGLTYRNVAGLVDLPKKPKRKFKFWTETEANRFLTAALDDRYYALFFLAIVSGMRRSELLGLTWQDLDWLTRRLHIFQQLSDDPDEMFAELKTEASERTLKLGEGTIDVLRQHYERQQLARQIAGDQWHEHDLMFPNTIGKPSHPKNLADRHYHPLIQKAGVKRIRFHDLRHTAASIMLSHGKPVIVVSKILGHARVSITQDIYGHLIPGTEDEVVAMMEDLVAPVEIEIDDLADA